MSRVIKFRAWDGEKMISPNSIFRDGTAWWKENSIPCMTNIVMQFTGLHDKNGKEIYEGDILSRKRHSEEGNWASKLIHDKDYFETVVFKNGCFVSDENGATIHKIITPMRISDSIEFKVIGNIHENPDLI